MTDVLDASAAGRLVSKSGFLVDLDGTMYLDDELLPGAARFLEELERHGKRHLFVTNNSSKSWRDYQERLHRMGIAASERQILTSGTATFDYLLGQTPHRRIYLVGTAALERDAVEAGLTLDENNPDCVVVGFDTSVDYRKLEIACRHLFAGKDYVATHPDRTCITQRGLVPDIAAIIAACEAVTRRLPKIVGKPFPEMVQAALGRLQTKPQNSVMIGDQLDTDMKMAANSGLLGVLLLSGETHPEHVAKLVPGEGPDIVASGIAVVAQALAEASL